MTEKKRNRPPSAEVSIRRRFYRNLSMIYAIRYCEEYPLYADDLHQVILDAFQHLYAPLGMKAYGDAEQALQVASRSIAFLEGYTAYLKKLFEITNDEAASEPAASVSQPNNSANERKNGNGNGNGHGNGKHPSLEDMAGLMMYDSFSD